MGFFARNQPRGFQHKSRFHDERKERLKLLERPEGEDEIPFDNKEKYRQRIRDNWDLRRAQSAGKSDGYAKRLIVQSRLPTLRYSFLPLNSFYDRINFRSTRPRC
jgi:hypothetical protein